jgi:hypothetical protein
MRLKLVTLAVSALAASVLALPATAGPGKGPKKPVPAACIQAAMETAKTNRETRRAAIKAFHQQQKAAREAFRSANANPTADQVKAFREARKADRKAFLESQRATAKANHAARKAALQACVANA